jgi:hypothetical protein
MKFATILDDKVAGCSNGAIRGRASITMGGSDVKQERERDSLSQC